MKHQLIRRSASSVPNPCVLLHVLVITSLLLLLDFITPVNGDLSLAATQVTTPASVVENTNLATLTVQIFQSNGSVLNANVAIVTADISGPGSVLNKAIAYTTNGTYTIKFNTSSTGLFSVNVAINGTNLPNNPYYVTFVSRSSPLLFTVYGKNGASCLTSSCASFEPTDQITTRVQYYFNNTTLNNFCYYITVPSGVGQVNSFIPSPSAVLPVAGSAKYGPLDTIARSNLPASNLTISLSVQGNTLHVCFGTYVDASTSTFMDLLVTFTLTDVVYSNGASVLFSAFASNNNVNTSVLTASFTVFEPQFLLYKGVVAASNPQASFSSNIHNSFAAPNTSIPRFGSPITSAIFIGGVDSVDSADFITMALFIQNNGSAAGYNVFVQDSFDSNCFETPSSGHQISVTNGNRDNLDNSGDLFGSGLSITPFIAAGGAGESVIIITYDLRIKDDVLAGTQCVNNIASLNFAASPSGPNFSAVTDSTIANIAKPTTSLTKISSCVAKNSGTANSAILEENTIEFKIRIPEGHTNSASVTLSLDNVLSLKAFTEPTAGSGLSGYSLSTNEIDINDDSFIDTLVVNIGDVVNPSDNVNNNNDEISFQIVVRPEVNNDNNVGSLKNINARTSYSLGNTTSFTSISLVAPVLQVSISSNASAAVQAGDIIQIVYTVSHTPESNSPAIAVDVTKAFDANLFTLLNVILNDGADESSGNILSAKLSYLDTTNTFVVTYIVRLESGVTAGSSISDTLATQWSSSSCDTSNVAEVSRSISWNTRASTLSYALNSTCDAGTSGNNLLIGEVATLFATLDLAHGTTLNSTVKFSMPTAQNSLVIETANIDFQGSKITFATVEPQLSDTNGDSYYDVVVFNFGEILNTYDGVSDNNDKIILAVQVYAVDKSSNQNGVNWSTQVLFTYDKTNSATSSVSFTVVEPTLTGSLSKDKSTVKAGDIINYSYFVQNTSPTAPANLVTITKTLSPYVSLNSVSTTAGVVSNSSSTDFTITISQVGRSSSFTVTYSLLVLDSAIHGSTISDSIAVHYESSNCGLASRPNNTASSSLSVTMQNPTLSQTFSSCLPETTGTTVGVMETLTFTGIVTIPQGTTSNLVVVIKLPYEFTYVSSNVFLNGTVSNSLLSVGSNATSVTPATVTGTYTLVTFIFGTPTISSIQSVFIVDVLGYANDIASVNRGKNFVVLLEMTQQYGTLSSTFPVTIVEPALTIAMSASPNNAVQAGTNVTYTVTISKAAASNTDAISVHISKTLDSSLKLVTGSIVNNQGAAVVYGSNDFTLDLSSLATTSTLTVTYTATVLSDAVLNTGLSESITVDYLSSRCPSGRSYSNLTSTNIVLKAPTTSSLIGSTCSVHGFPNKYIGANRDVAMFEVVSFQTRITLPQGTLRSAVLNVTFPAANLTYVNSSVVSIGSSITNTAGLEVASAGTYDAGVVSFNFGNIQNQDDGVSDSNDEILIQVSAYPHNSKKGNSITVNSVLYNQYSSTSSSIAIDIVEPDLSVTLATNTTSVEAGSHILYTITIINTPLAETEAQNVTINKLLQPHLELVGTPIATNGIVSTAVANTVSVTLSTLQMSQNLVITYVALVLETAESDTVLSDNVVVVYQSSPCNYGKIYNTGASTNVNMKSPVITFTNVDSCVPGTIGNNASVLENVTFEAVVKLPQGFTNNSQIVVQVPTNMAISSTKVMSIGTQISGSVLNADQPAQTVTATTATFMFGALTNHPDNAQDSADEIVVRVAGYPKDIAQVQKGTTLNVATSFNHTRASYPQNIVLTVTAPFLSASMTADKTLIEAGDVVTYTYLLQHNSSSNAPAIFLNVSKTLSEYLQLDFVTTNIGSATPNGNSFIINVDTLPLDLVLNITYKATVLPNVPTESSLFDSFISNWQSSVCGDGRYYSVSASKTIPTKSHNYIFNVVESCSSETVQPNVALQEDVTYEGVVTLAQGTTNDVRVIITLPSSPGNMYLVSSTVVAIGSNINGSALVVSSPAITSDSGSDGYNETVTFNFGTLVNYPDAVSNDNDKLVVRITAYPTGATQNQIQSIGSILQHQTNPTGSGYSKSISITIVEPVLSVTITPNTTLIQAGDIVEFTLVVSHTAASKSPVYFVSINKTLQADLELVNVWSDVAVENPSIPVDTFNLTLANLTLGSTITVKYQVLVRDTVRLFSTLTDSVNVNYQSSPCENGKFYLASKSTTVDTKQFTVAISIPESCVNETTGSNIAVMESITYNALVTLPQGTVPNTAVDVTLPSAFVYVSSRVVSIGGSITGNTLNEEGSGANNFPTIHFALGNLVNHADGQTNQNDTILLEVIAYPSNTSTVINGATFPTTSYLTDGSSTVNSQTTVTIKEPNLILTFTSSKNLVQAEDVVTYTITIYHSGTSTSAALLLDVAKELHSNLELIPDSITATHNASVTVVGNGFDITLPSFQSGTGNFVITYSATVLQSVVSEVPITDSALVKYQSSNCNPGRSYTATQSNTIQVRSAIFTFTNVGSCVVETTAPGYFNAYEDVAPMEVIFFQSIVRLPQGSINNAAIRVDLANTTRKLIPLNYTVVSVGSSIQESSLSAGDPGTAYDMGNDGIMDRFVFTFGNIVNNPDGVTNSADDVVVQVTAYVEDSSSVISHTTIGATSTWSNTVNTTTLSVTYDIVEPFLATFISANKTSNVEAGDVILFTIFTNHTTSSSSAALGLGITQTLNNQFTLIDGSVTTSGGSVSYGDNSFSIALSSLRPSESLTVTYQAIVRVTAPAQSTIGDLVNVTYSSSSCMPGRYYSRDNSVVLGTKPPTYSFSSVATCVPETGNSQYTPANIDLAVLETITFHGVVTFSQGTTNNAVVNITLPKTPGRLAVVNATVFSLGSSLNSSNLVQDAIGYIYDSNADTVLDSVSFDFGTVVNTPDGGQSSADQIIVQVVAVLSDLTDNTQGKAITTSSSFTHATGTYSGSVVADIVEPFLNVILVPSKTLIEAGDIITYTANITHISASHSAALLLYIKKTLSPYLLLNVSSVSSNIGTVNSAPANSIDISLNSFELGSTLTVQYQALVLDTLPFESTLTDNITVGWQSSSCNSGRNYTNSTSNTVSTMTPLYTFQVTDSCVDETSGLNVAILENVVYTSTTYLPHGTTSNANVTILLPQTPGKMRLVSSRVVSIGNQIINSAINSSNSGTELDTNSDNVTDAVVFYFGTITNKADGLNDTNDRLVVEVITYPEDVSTLNSGKTLTTSATFSHLTGNFPRSVVVTIVEPVLQVSMTSNVTNADAGDAILYKYTITHTSSSNEAGIFVSVQKALQANLQLVPGSVTSTVGTVNSAAANSINVTLSSFPVGSTLTIQYQAIVLTSVITATSLSDNVVVTWQSSSCADGRYYSANSSNSISIRGATYDFFLLSTCVSQTGSPNQLTANEDVAPLETITYRSVIYLAEGTNTGGVLRFTLPNSASFLGVVGTPVFTYGSKVTGANSVAIQDRNSDNINDTVTITFDNLVNTPDGLNNTNDQILVDLTVVVADVSSNTQAVTLLTATQFNYSGASFSKSHTVEIVEPTLTTVLNADKTLIEAGDTITYSVNISHTAASKMAGLLISVVKTLSSDLQLVPGSVLSNIGVINAATIANTINITLNVLPLGGFLNIQYQALVLPTLLSQSNLMDSIRVDYQSSNCNPGRFYNSTASKSITTKPLSFGSGIVSTCVNRTGASNYYSAAQDVSVKEHITFRATTTFAQGTTTNAVFTVSLSNNTAKLIYYSSRVYSIGSSITTSLLSVGSEGSLTDTNGDGINDQVSFSFGTVVNQPDGVSNSFDTIVVEVVAFPEDSSANSRSALLNTISQFAHTAGTYSQTIPVEIVEPTLTMTLNADKSLIEAGDLITYNLTISHTAASNSPATLVVALKTLVSHLQLVPGSVSSNIGVVNAATIADTINVTLTNLPLGSTLTITYQATVRVSVPTQSSLSDDVVLFYQSSNCNTGRLYNTSASRSISTKFDSFVSAIIGGCVDRTGVSNYFNTYPDFAVKEHITFHSTATFAQGTTNNAIVQVFLPSVINKMVYYSSRVYSIGSRITTSLLSVGSEGSLTDTNGDGINDRISFSFGTVVNQPDGVSNSFDTIVVEVVAFPEDSSANMQSSSLAFSANFSYQADKLITTVNSFDIVEPSLQATLSTPTTIADAGDSLNFTITISQTASSKSPALLLVLSKALPAEFQLVAGSVTSTIGTVDESVTDVVHVTAANLPWGTTWTIQYSVILRPNIVTGLSAFSDTISLEYQSAACPSGRLGTANATTSFATRTDTYSFGITSTCVTQTVLPNVTIGELITYRSIVYLAEGTTNDVEIVVTLPNTAANGYLVVVGPTISYGSSVSGTATPVIEDRNGDSYDDLVRVSWDSLINTPDNSNDTNDQVIVDITVVVLDDTANTRGKTITASGQMTYTAATFSGSSSVIIVEPALQAAISANATTIEAGQVISYTITLSHLPNATTAAQSVSFTKTLDSYLSLKASSITTNVGTFSVSGNSFTVNVTTLDIGTNLVVHYDATVIPSALADYAFVESVTATYLSSTCNPAAHPARTYTTNTPSSTVTMLGTASTFEFFGSCLTETPFTPTTADLAILETVIVRANVILPQGVTRDVIITVSLPTGPGKLRLDSASVLSIGSSLTVQNVISTGTTNDINGDGLADQAVFIFGNITNVPHANKGAADTILIEIAALTIDIVGNTNLVNLPLTMNLQHATGNFDTVINARVVEPAVKVSVKPSTSSQAPGYPITFTITANHTAASTSAAYNLTITSTASEQLFFTNMSLSSNIGTVSVNDRLITFTLDVLPLGTIAHIVFRLTLDNHAVPGDQSWEFADLTYYSSTCNNIAGRQKSGSNNITLVAGAIQIDCLPECINSGRCVGKDICNCTGTGYTGSTCEIPICDPLCTNGGTCILPYTCNCTGTGYNGSICQTPVCSPNCQNEGRCIAPNTCNCTETGYDGDTCQNPICTGGCLNGGNCTSPETCKCAKGWNGTNCELPICSNGCGHGSCVAPETCSCQDGWNGTTCNNAICTPACVNGTCTSPNFCTCNSGYNGTRCQSPICNVPCKNNGVCILPDTCNCAGTRFEGFDCSIPACSPTCSNGGTCVALANGNHVCQCPDGWTGVTCSTRVTCPARNECGVGGVCLGNNVCNCTAPYSGLDCSTCITGYYHAGSYCVACPPCAKGTCTAQGTCNCQQGWTGPLCDTCGFGYFGANCARIPGVISVAPSSGLELGGTRVSILGANYVNKTNLLCKFGDYGTTNASFVDQTRLACVTPAGVAGVTVTVDVIDGQAIFNSGAFFYYLGACVGLDCGQGTCSIGRCSCFLGWTGEHCNIAVFTPEIAPIPTTNITEGNTYTSSIPILLNGTTAPVTWTLTQAPTDITYTFDPATGVITWRNPQASPQAFQFAFSAKNMVGTSTVAYWTVFVNPSYNVTCYNNATKNVPVGTPILLYGRTLLFNQVPTYNKPAQLWLNYRGVVQYFDVTTDIYGNFTYLFVPKLEVGTITAGARHPAVLSLTPTTSFGITGMRTEPPISQAPLISGNPGWTVASSLITVSNLGDIALNNLVVSLSFQPHKNMQVLTATFLRDNLVSLQTTGLNITILSNGSVPERLVNGSITASDGTTTQFAFSVKIIDFAPDLQITPSTGIKQVARESESTLEFTIKNIGLGESGDITITLPPISFIDLTTPSFIPSLRPGASASVNLLITPPSNQTIATYTGSITAFSERIFTSFGVQIQVTGALAIRMTVNVADESGCPDLNLGLTPRTQVTDATVTIRNTATGTTATARSTSTGVVFDNVTAGMYEVRVEKEGHSADVRPVVVDSSGTVNTFVQTRVVEQTWGVSATDDPTVVLYNLATRTVPNVQGPVIVAQYNDKGYVDLQELIEAIENSINGQTIFTLKITNSGTATAQNVQINLPYHPSLQFSILTSPGDVDPTTSLVVPIQATKVGKRSENDPTCVNGQVVWSLKCDSTKTYATTLTFSPGTPCQDDPDSSQTAPVPTGTLSITPTVATDIPCEAFPCEQELWDCISSANIKGCPNCVLNRQTANFDLSRLPYDTVDCSLTCGAHEGDGEGVYQVAMCLQNLKDRCNVSSISNTTTKEVAIKEMFAQFDTIYNYLSMVNDIFGNSSWLNVYDTDWDLGFLRAVSDDSPIAFFFSQDEVNTLQSTIPNHLPSIDDVSFFINRWNVTKDNWNQGYLYLSSIPSGYSTNSVDYGVMQTRFQQLQTDTALANFDGYNSIIESTLASIDSYKRAVQSGQGSCASVKSQSDKIRIFSRESFTNRIIIQSNIATPLTNISAVVTIKVRGTTPLVNELFNISAPIVTGVTGGVDGRGVLPGQALGTIEYSIIPLQDAAVYHDYLYEIGGYVTYILKGKQVFVPIYAQIIQVLPDPKLAFHYFYTESVIAGDDPNTPDVEPSIPTDIGLLIINSGYGSALNVKIASATVKIVDSVAGFIRVPYQIVDSQVQNSTVSPSFTLQLGDIPPASTTVAKWTVTASKTAKLSSFASTTQYITSLGDSRPSPVDYLSIHNLLRVVDVCSTGDELPDFLVDDIGNDGIPDTIYCADGTFRNTTEVPDTNATVDSPVLIESETFYKLNAPMSEDGVVYISFPNPVDSVTNPGLNLIRVERLDGTVLGPSNYWRTITPIAKRQSTYTDIIHILDYNSTGFYNLIYQGLTSVRNLNVSKATPNSISLTWEPASGAVQYRVQQKRAVFGTWMTLASSVVKTNYTVSNLSPSTNYEFRVQAGDLSSYEAEGVNITAETAPQDTSICGDKTCGTGNSLIVIGGQCYCVCNTICPEGSVVDPTDCSCNYCKDYLGNPVGEGETCEDGDPCTVNDVCLAKRCYTGVPKVCEAPDVCHTATCEPTTGLCVNTTIDGCVITTGTGEVTTGPAITTGTSSETAAPVDNQSESEYEGNSRITAAIVVSILFIVAVVVAVVIMAYRGKLNLAVHQVKQRIFGGEIDSNVIEMSNFNKAQLEDEDDYTIDGQTTDGGYSNASSEASLSDSEDQTGENFSSEEEEESDQSNQ